VRQLNGAPVRAILISGNPVGEEALSRGAEAFLAKPFPMQRLLAEVARILGAELPVRHEAVVSKNSRAGRPVPG
jgi:FixJ family two-component response regulator